MANDPGDMLLGAIIGLVQALINLLLTQLS